MQNMDQFYMHLSIDTLHKYVDDLFNYSARSMNFCPHVDAAHSHTC